MMSKAMIATRVLKRKKWLGSASVLAAATALMAVSSADIAYAQSAMGGARSVAPAPEMMTVRQSAQKVAPRKVTRAKTSVPPRVPSVRSQSQPNNSVILPNVSTSGPVNTVAPTAQSTVTFRPPTSSSATSSPTVSIASPPPIFVTTQSTATTSATVPVDGISVQASAEFDNTQIDFRPGVAGDVVEVLGTSAIIDWRTFTSGAENTDVTFLNAADNLDFTSAQADYTVLNRIFTPNFDSAVRIDGNVTSTVLGGNAIGGNVWFYSAGGLIVGADASFNVGSLLLSTSTIDPADVSAGAFDVDFTGVTDTNSFIRIEENASITANNTNSYVAIIAPRIEQGGSVRTNGSTAYVASEEATMTIQNGLFDISVSVGSGHSSGDGIVHTGSTGGPGSTSQFDEQAIYFVAVPKNTAINMLVGGSVGYDPAVSASVDNGQIILTTGNRVARVDTTTRVSDGMGGTTSVPISFNTVDTLIDGGGAGSITLENITLTSFTDVFAEDTITVQAGVSSATDSVIVAGNGGDVIDLGLTAGNAVNVQVAGEGVIDVSGSLNITAGDGQGNGGDVTINLAQDPSLTTPVGGLFTGLSLNVDASARGLDDFFTIRNNGGNGVGQDAVAGQISIDISDGATLAAGGSLNLDTSAQGGKGESQNGSATAGGITLNLADGSIITDNGLSIDTRAIRSQAGKIGGNGSGLIGADGAAGDVTINLLGGSSSLGTVSVQSTAEASVGGDETVAQSNDAIGSDFILNVSGGDHTMNGLSIFGEVSGRESYDGVSVESRPGQVSRSTATISVTNSGTNLDIAGNLILDLGASGDVGASPSNAVNISVVGTNSAVDGGLNIGEELSIFTGVIEGSLGAVSEAGSVFLTANNGTFSVDRLTIDANADAFFFPNTDISGSDFKGGDVSITANNGGVFSSASGTEVNSEGVGLVNSGGLGTGVGRGGTITVLADGGSINLGGTTTLAANGFASAVFNGGLSAGEGVGGTVRITVQGANGSLAFGDLEAGTDGSFAQDFSEELLGSDGAGSRGSGGLTEFNILGGTFSANNVTASSIGEGGQGGTNVSPNATAASNGFNTAAEGGDGEGGDVVFNLDGGAASMVNLTVSASGIGGAGGDGSVFSVDPQNGGAGGDATGGTATFNSLSGSLTVSGTLTVEANGNSQSNGVTSGGGGGFGRGTAGGDAGASTGGTATFNMNGTATVDAGAMIVSTQAFGGRGGASSATFAGDPDQGGGQGGDANGGVATFDDTSGALTFGSLTVDASGIGGRGGSSSGNTIGEAQGDGGAGGEGTGGSALVALNQDNADARDFSVRSLGAGGQGGSGLNAGAGGSAQGGEAELAVNNVDVVFGVLSIDSSASGGRADFADGMSVADGAAGGDATGGTSTLRVAGVDAAFRANNLIQIRAGATGAAGGDGTFSFNDADVGGNGGAGGSGTGGTASVVVSDGATYRLDADTISFSADANGGQGGNGGNNFGGGQSGDGGAGGDATGGTAAIIATTGADLTLQSFSVPFLLSSNGRGGSGGTGGEVSGGAAGAGGNGGNGTGGSPTISAIGATITGDEIELFAEGFGGAGGLGGSDGSVNIGADGNGGNGTGGSPLIEVVEGSPGIITLGNVTITATGAGGTGAVIGLGDGGQVTIRDLSPDPAGLITFGGLDVIATGDPTATGGLLTFESASGPITVNGNLNADVAGDIVFTMDGTGQVFVTGAATLAATQDITATHANNGADNATIETGATFNATANRDFLFSEGTFINAGRFVVIDAQNVAYDNISSLEEVFLTANAGDITGTLTGTIIASAVNDAVRLNAAGNVTFGVINNVDGDPVTRDGNINVDAGGNITGTSAISGQTVSLDAGGLISVGTVDTLETTIGTVTINGGAIDLGALNARFISNLTTTTGDISIDNLSGLTNVDMNSAADIIVGTASTGTFAATAAGDIELGTLITTGGVADVRLNSNGDVSYTSIDGDRLVTINAVTVSGGLASTLEADAGITVDAEAIDIGDVTSTGGFVTLTSNSDGITTGDLTSTIFGVIVDSAAEVDLGDVTSAGTSRILSLTDMSVGNVDAGGSTVLNSGGNLNAGALVSRTNSPGLSVTVNGDADIESATSNGTFGINVAGELTGGSFTGAGGFSVVNITAASVDITSVESTSQSVNVTANAGDAIVGNATSNFNTSITGDNVTLNDGTIGGSLTLTSTVGDITGSGTITVGGTADFDAAEDIAIGSLDATNVDLTSGGDILFNAITSPNDITLTAALGQIGTNAPDMGNITSGGDVDLTALTMALGDITATGTGSITANATAGDASFGDLTSDTTIAITAVGTPSVESVTSVGNTSITGVSIGLDGGNVGGSLVLDASAGDINIALDGSDQLLVGSNATFNATGDINVTHSNNASDQISILVQGDTFTANLGGDFTSGAGSIISSAGELLVSADGNIDASDLRAEAAIDLLAGGNVTVGDLTATGPQGRSNFNGIAIAAGFLDFGSAIFAFDPAANVVINGDVSSYTDVVVDAGGTVTFASGSSTTAADAISVFTGDDIIVEQGAFLSSADNPSSTISPTLATPGTANITLNAGGLANLLSTPLTPIASIVIDGSLNANTGSIILNANAIEALDSDLSGVSLTADVRDAPASTAFLSDDDGLLSAPCLEGIVCLGDMAFSDQIAIGQESNNDVIRLFIEQATVNATDIFITIREDIVMGTNGIDTTLNASNTFSATSNTGNVDLRDAAISANQILIDAAGSLVGSANLSSTNDIGITVGGSIVASSIVTDGELTGTDDVGGTLEGQYSVPGSFSVGLLSQGASDIDISAGGDIDVGEAVSPANVTLSADGDTSLGAADVSGDINLTGQNISFDALDAGGSILADAVAGSINSTGGSAISAGADVDLIAAGDIDIADVQGGNNISLDAGGNASFFGLDAGGNVAVNAAGAVNGFEIVSGGSAAVDGDLINLGDVTALGAASISGSSIIVGNVDADQIDLISLTDILFDSLSSLNAITVSATNGLIGINNGPGDIESDDDVTLGAQTINVGTIDAGGNIDVQAAGDLGARADAAGDVALVSLGGDATIAGSTGRNISLSAGGDLDIVGNVIAASDLTMDAGGSFTLQSQAIGENITVNSSDVVITPDGRLGDATLTQSITFNGFDEVFLGGAGGSGAAYEIDNDEFTRIHSGGDIVVTAIAGVTGSTGAGALITVDTLDITAGDGSTATDQNIGQTGGLVLQSEGDIAVIGNATIANATQDTLFIAEASDLVRVNTEAGGIFISDGNGELAGVIEITATDFNAVTDAAFADIQGMSLSDIDARLGDSDGVDRPDGVIRADTLDIDTTASQVFIQNTVPGTDFADRRGFDVNALLISDSGGTIQPIVINGLIGGIAGIDTIPLVDITSTINTASTINGCFILDAGACLPVIVDPIDIVPPTDPSRDVIEEGLDPEDTSEASGTIQSGLLEFSPDFEFGTEPLIDEPVTGAGNEDLWVDPDCPPGANPEVCAAEPAE